MSHELDEITRACADILARSTGLSAEMDAAVSEAVHRITAAVAALEVRLDTLEAHLGVQSVFGRRPKN
jgi:hypothetical protein